MVEFTHQQKLIIDRKLCEAYQEINEQKLDCLSPLEFHNLVMLESFRLLLGSVDSLDDLLDEIK